jgi:hypothetical protein
MQNSNSLAERYQAVANFFKRTAWANYETAIKMSTPEFREVLLNNCVSACNAARSYRQLAEEAREAQEMRQLNEAYLNSPDQHHFLD